MELDPLFLFGVIAHRLRGKQIDEMGYDDALVVELVEVDRAADTDHLAGLDAFDLGDGKPLALEGAHRNGARLVADADRDVDAAAAAHAGIDLEDLAVEVDVGQGLIGDLSDMVDGLIVARFPNAGPFPFLLHLDEVSLHFGEEHILPRFLDGFVLGGEIIGGLHVFFLQIGHIFFFYGDCRLGGGSGNFHFGFPCFFRRFFDGSRPFDGNGFFLDWLRFGLGGGGRFNNGFFFLFDFLDDVEIVG